MSRNNTVTVKGYLVKDLRVQAGWTQEELADEAEVSKRTIENLEKGKATTLPTVKRVADALGTTPSELIENGNLLSSEATEKECLERLACELLGVLNSSLNGSHDLLAMGRSFRVAIAHEVLTHLNYLSWGLQQFTSEVEMAPHVPEPLFQNVLTLMGDYHAATRLVATRQAPHWSAISDVLIDIGKCIDQCMKQLRKVRADAESFRGQGKIIVTEAHTQLAEIRNQLRELHSKAVAELQSGK